MYMFKNIQEFYEAYRNQEELEYGKQLKFVPKRENFTKESKAYFDYIIDFHVIFLEVSHGIHIFSVDTDFEVQMWTCGISGAAYKSNELTS